jgi:hypothetical protein
MSAICRDMGWRAVTDGTLKSTAPSITACPTPQEKRLFVEVAAKRQVSESALALVAIRALLGFGCARPSKLSITASPP